MLEAHADPNILQPGATKTVQSKQQAAAIETTNKSQYSVRIPFAQFYTLLITDFSWPAVPCDNKGRGPLRPLTKCKKK